MSDWRDFELDKTMRDYDYTMRAVCDMNRIVDSADFESMDADAIFRYLSGEMNIILFPDYLKRYIFEKTEIDIPFKQIPDSMYSEIISSAFSYNKAPFTFGETQARKNTIIKGWLTQGSVTRRTVFVLGFGLKMPAEDVNDFLTKGIKEDGFDFADPEETVYWFCYKKGLPYAQARKLLAVYQETEPEEYPEKTWESMSQAPEFFLTSLQNLQNYLMMLKSRKLYEKKQEAAYNEFKRLYAECCEIIADMHNQDALYIDGGGTLDASEVMPADLEKELCSGIPVNEKGNLEKMTRSCFASLFKNKRMSRQRISAILNRKHAVERFDLITLMFFIYAQTVEPDWPAERYMKYIDDVNEVLHRCRMSDIYPVNPYEAFVLMCLVADAPLETYAEIWEKSYDSPA